MLSRYRHSTEVHLRTAWVDTRADVLVNVGVLLAGAVIAVSGWRVVDLIAGVIIAGFVIHEGWELWESGDDAGKANPDSRISRRMADDPLHARPQQAFFAWTGGHFTVPNEQKTQQLPAFGRIRIPQPSHS